MQASRLWYKKLCKFLEKRGYEHSSKPPCVFRKIEGEDALMVNVDDILVCTKKKEWSI
jgi:hypothetical protein